MSRYVDARGRQRQFKLGSADVLLLEQARRLGRSVLAKALLGADPQTRRQELRSIPTLNQFARDRYLPMPKLISLDEINLRLHILPALGRLTLDEITGRACCKIWYSISQTVSESDLQSRIINDCSIPRFKANQVLEAVLWSLNAEGERVKEI